VVGKPADYDDLADDVSMEDANRILNTEDDMDVNVAAALSTKDGFNPPPLPDRTAQAAAAEVRICNPSGLHRSLVQVQPACLGLKSQTRCHLSIKQHQRQERPLSPPAF
jgi:hypothetical protein